MPLVLFRVAIRDEPGALARVARHLANRNVDLKGFVVDPAGMQLLTDQVEAAHRAFADAGIMTMTTPVFEVDLENRPGALAQAAQRLADAGVDIVSAFGVASGSLGRIYIHASDAARAAPVIAALHRGASGFPAVRSSLVPAR